MPLPYTSIAEVTLSLKARSWQLCMTLADEYPAKEVVTACSSLFCPSNYHTCKLAARTVHEPKTTGMSKVSIPFVLFLVVLLSIIFVIRT